MQPQDRHNKQPAPRDKPPVTSRGRCDVTRSRRRHKAVASRALYRRGVKARARGAPWRRRLAVVRARPGGEAWQRARSGGEGWQRVRALSAKRGSAGACECGGPALLFSKTPRPPEGGSNQARVPLPLARQRKRAGRARWL